MRCYVIAGLIGLVLLGPNGRERAFAGLGLVFLGYLLVHDRLDSQITLS